MRWQAVGLVAALLVAGGGLALFAGDGERVVTTANDGDERPEAPESRDANRPEPATEILAPPGSTSGLVEQWTIEVLDADGTSVDGASVVARSSENELSSEGATNTFANVDPGVWDVVVTAPRYFDVHRRVTLNAVQSQHTTLRVSDTRMLSGVVVDRRGEPVERKRIWLLPKAAAHPAHSSKRYELPNAITSSGGQFSLPIRMGGAYRLSLGDAGELARATSDSFEVVANTKGRARWVVPASVRLTVRVEDLEDEEVAHVMVVMDEFDVSQLEEAPQRGPRDSDSVATVKQRPTATPGKRSEATATEAKPGSDGEGPSEAPDPATTAYLESERARMAASVASDGVQLRRLRVRAGRDVVTDELPPNEVLRFRLLRGSEMFNASVSFQSRQGDDAVLTLKATPPLPPGTALPVQRRTCAGTIERVRRSEKALSEGLDVR